MKKNTRIKLKENSASAAFEQSKSKFDSSGSESYTSLAQREKRSSKSRRRHRGASTTSSVFYSFLMGAGLTAENNQRAEISDEPFVFVDALDRFGLYDSTDTEISELRYPVKESTNHLKVTTKKPVGKESPKEIRKEASPISKYFKEDQGSSVSNNEERFISRRLSSAEDRPHVSAEYNSEINTITSVVGRFASPSFSTESEITSTGKENRNPSEDGSNTASFRSTVSPQLSYELNPKVNNKNSNKNQKKGDQLNHLNQQPSSDQDIYYTPESSATKVLRPLQKTESPKGRTAPKTENAIQFNRRDSGSSISSIEGKLKEIERKIQEPKRTNSGSDDSKIEDVLEKAWRKTKYKVPKIKGSKEVDNLKKSTNEKLSRPLESQMSNDRRHSSLDRQNSWYSREPPERDQNYDGSPMKKNHSQSSEIHQGNKTWCQCKNADDCRRLNHQQHTRKNHPEHRKRTTYDLVKSAENLRQQNQEHNKNPCTCSGKSKQGQQCQSSPEVCKNKQNMKSEDPCNSDTCEYYSDYAGKNDGYGCNQMEQVKPRKYPYEEPLQDSDYNNENHDQNCACDHCNRRNHYRNCKCCNCLRNDDHVSCDSDDSQCNLNLAYQKSEDYPDLVDEIENSISRRNKERVKKTMRQFEMLSRQNKGLEKPICDDEEDEEDDDNVNRFPCNKRNCQMYNSRPRSREAQYYNNQKPRPPCCYDRSNYQTKSECLSERPAFSATPFPQNRGYVEKVARYMDPSMSDTAQKYPRYRPEYSNSRWQMDSRSGEWVKVCDDGYDFENSYPPLPAPPPPMYREGGPYRDYENYPKCQGNPNFFNGPNPYRTHGAFKRSNAQAKQCQCRHCMQPSNNGSCRY